MWPHFKIHPNSKWVLVPYITTNRLILTLVPLVESSCMWLSDERPAQFRFNRLIIKKVMLVYFLDDFVTVLFCIALIQSVCFWSFNSIKSIDHSYQSNGDLMLCYTAICGVQNESLQAEILTQVYELLTKLFYRIKPNDHNGIQEQACTLLINLKSGYIQSLLPTSCIKPSIASAYRQKVKK